MAIIIFSGLRPEPVPQVFDQQDKLRRSGVQQNEILRLQADYYDKVAKAVPTSTLSDYLKEFNELRSVVGGEKAAQVAPWSMQLEAIISNATGKTASGEGFIPSAARRARTNASTG